MCVPKTGNLFEILYVGPSLSDSRLSFLSPSLLSLPLALLPSLPFCSKNLLDSSPVLDSKKTSQQRQTTSKNTKRKRERERGRMSF